MPNLIDVTSLARCDGAASENDQTIGPKSNDRMAKMVVRRGKAAPSSGREAHPAADPAGRNRDVIRPAKI